MSRVLADGEPPRIMRFGSTNNEAKVPTRRRVLEPQRTTRAGTCEFNRSMVGSADTQHCQPAVRSSLISRPYLPTSEAGHAPVDARRRCARRRRAPPPSRRSPSTSAPATQASTPLTPSRRRPPWPHGRPWCPGRPWDRRRGWLPPCRRALPKTRVSQGVSCKRYAELSSWQLRLAWHLTLRLSISAGTV